MVISCGEGLQKTQVRLYRLCRFNRSNITLIFSLYNKGGRSEENNSDDAIGGFSQVKLQELLVFDFGKLATATNNFHLSNKLGEGGFGPVYKVS